MAEPERVAELSRRAGTIAEEKIAATIGKPRAGTQ
jgi:hypothetical protein